MAAASGGVSKTDVGNNRDFEEREQNPQAGLSDHLAADRRKRNRNHRWTQDGLRSAVFVLGQCQRTDVVADYLAIQPQ